MDRMIEADLQVDDRRELQDASATIGVVAGQEYYFIANSHGGLMRRAKGPIAEEPLTEPAVLRIRLK
jgi:hypothetical protein